MTEIQGFDFLNVSVKPNGLTLYVPSNGGCREKLAKLDTSQKGIISRKSKSRLRNSLDWLFLLSAKKVTKQDKIVFRMSEITLTLPSKQRHSDKVIVRKCLNQFLTEMRNRYDMTNYVRKSEVQKNGNIHFHILSNMAFLPKDELKEIWNRIIEKLGYITAYRRERLKSGLPFTMPSSTRVDSIKSEKQFKKYIAKQEVSRFGHLRKKYLAKDDTDKGKRAVEGKVWFVSRELSKLRGITLDYADCYNDFEQLRKKGVEIIEGDFFAFFKAPILKWFGKLEYLTQKVQDFLDIYLGKISEETGEIKSEILGQIKKVNCKQLTFNFGLSLVQSNPYDY